MAERPLALVTGASSGIGRATAARLVGDGWRVLVGYGAGSARAEAVASALDDGTGTVAIPVHVPLGTPAAVPDLADRLTETFGPVTGLVNNAGINDRSPAHALAPDRLQQVLDVNLTSPLLLASALARHLLDRGLPGAVVNVTSVHDSVPITGGAAYCASKGGLATAGRALALELAGAGIRVNTVAPGETATPMNGVRDEASYRSIVRPAIPAGRPGGVDEVAAAIAWLLGPDASYVTGATLVVDGGLTLTAAEANAAYAGTMPGTLTGTLTSTPGPRPMPQEDL